MIGAFSFESLIFTIITLVIAFTIHELAHAYSAYALGDHTAASMGRLTLNPMKHLDPVGTIALILMGFGWAKPVPVNVNRLKYGKYGNMIVSVAGPLSNLVLAAIGVLASIIILRFMGTEMGAYPETMLNFLNYFIRINVVLFVFNLLPVPPLDGYRIVETYLPYGTRQKVDQYYFYVFLVFLFCMMFDPAYNVTFGPFFHVLVPGIEEFLFNLGVKFF